SPNVASAATNRTAIATNTCRHTPIRPSMRGESCWSAGARTAFGTWRVSVGRRCGRRDHRQNGRMILTEIDHVAIAVRDLDAAIAYYERAFGAKVHHREVVDSDGVDEALIKVGD